MANKIDASFVQYCRQCTDAQLENVLRDEWQAFQHRDYFSAHKAACERGWSVVDGERV